MAIAKDFLITEKEFLRYSLDKFNNYKQAIVVGCGDSNYVDLVTFANMSYLGLDPYASSENGSNIINATLEEYLYARPDHEEKVFILWFNVISHINLSVLKEGNGLMKGDIVINSTWNNNHETRMLIEKYYASFLPELQKEVFNADIILARNRSIAGLLNKKSYYHKGIAGNNIFEFAII